MVATQIKLFANVTSKNFHPTKDLSVITSLNGTMETIPDVVIFAATVGSIANLYKPIVNSKIICETDSDCSDHGTCILTKVHSYCECNTPYNSTNC